MSLENGTYINHFDLANPAGTDNSSTTDDHLRLIKALVQQTFPNLTGAVTTTQGELNTLTGVSATLTSAKLNTMETLVDGLTRTAEQLNGAKGADVASAAELVLGTDGTSFDVTGVVAITSIATLGIGSHVTLRFDDVLVLTHHSVNLVLLGEVDITTSVGDIAVFMEYALGDWRCVSYEIAGGRKIVQQITFQAGISATGTTILPIDDTRPQNDEGDEVAALTITPTSEANLLRIEFILNLAHSATGAILGAALFQDLTVDALAATIGGKTSVADNPTTLTLSYTMVAGTLLATTFKVRAGGDLAGTTTFNGFAGGRIFGGFLVSSITITETTP